MSIYGTKGGGGMNPSDVQNQAADSTSDQQDYTTDSSAAGSSRDSSYPIGVGMGPPPPPESGPGGRASTPDVTTEPMYGRSDRGQEQRSGGYGGKHSSLPENSPRGHTGSKH